MNQEDDAIDDHFKSKLESYEKVPSPATWNTILESIQTIEKKETATKDTKTYRWIAAAVITLMIAGSWMFFFFIDKEKESGLPKQYHTRQSIEDRPGLTQNHSATKPVDENKSDTIAGNRSKRRDLKKQSEAAVIVLHERTQQQKREILLPDSSVVSLNVYSEISYPSQFINERVIHLKGEAFFEVTPDKNKPFIIYGNLSKTEVKGTSFLLRSVKEEGEDEIYVRTGKVYFANAKDNAKKVLLEAGTWSIVKDDEPLKAAPIDNVNYAAWKDEKIVFHNTLLKEVIPTLEHYYAIKISVTNPEVLQCRFTGIFEKSELKEILQVLSMSFNLTSDRVNNKYMLSGKGCK